MFKEIPFINAGTIQISLNASGHLLLGEKREKNANVRLCGIKRIWMVNCVRKERREDKGRNDGEKLLFKGR